MSNAAYKQFFPPAEDDEEGTLLNQTTASFGDEGSEDDYFHPDGGDKPGIEMNKVIAISVVFGIGIICLCIYALGGVEPGQLNSQRRAPGP